MLFFLSKGNDYVGFYGRLVIAIIDLLVISIILLLLNQFLTFVLYDNTLLTRQHEVIYEVVDIISHKINDYPGISIYQIFNTPDLLILIGNLPIYRIIFIQCIQLLTIFAFFILLWTKYGATTGCILLDCKIVDKNTYHKIGYCRAIVRSIIAIVGNMLLVGIILPIFDKKNQTLHDKITNTIVIYNQALVSITEATNDK